jgi:hypothetical protein
MTDERRLVALVLAVLGFGFAVFGLVRGLSDPGLAQGTRYIITIDKQVDDEGLAKAKHDVGEQLHVRVMNAAQQLVVETPDDHLPDLVGMHVTHREAFTRPTSFLARTWIFLAIAGVLFALAAAIGLRG